MHAEPAVSQQPRTSEALLEVRDLVVEATTATGRVPLLHGMLLTVKPGSRVGIVGESGSGKSMTASAIMRLLPEGVEATAGSIHFRGRDLMKLTEEEMRDVRGKEISIVYQNAVASLNPIMKVGDQISAVCRTHTGLSRAAARDRAVEILDSLGIPAAARRARDYPHHFSGGMAQRVAIAMALVCDPMMLIADEPTTGLDATIQMQVLEVIERSVRERGAALILISHDFGVIEAMTDVIAVVYAGMLLELGSARAVLSSPLSPYTVDLMAGLSTEAGVINFIPGRIPDPGSYRNSCPFADRCRLVSERCRVEAPVLRELESGHLVACHNV
jgi:oligopeptide/dipeptide ABC transporter ATP-binding protein